TLRDDLLGVNIHFPAGELGRQARVLAALADGQRQLIFRHQDFDALAGFIQFKALELGRRKGVVDERPDVRRPWNHVHLFVVEFANDVFHALAAHADARADRVHLVVARINRHFGAETRFAGDPFDFNRAVVDFRNFKLKEFDDEARVGAGQNNFRPVRAQFDRLDVAADALPHLIFLRGHALAVRQQRLVFAQVQYHVRTLKPPHGTADDVPDAVLEFGENERLFRLPDFLHERLLGVLRGNAPEAGRRDFLFDFVADLSAGFEAACVEDGNLIVLGNDLVGDDELGERLDVTVFLVNLDAQFTRRADRLLGGGQQRLLHGANEDITIDALFALPKFQDCQKIRIHTLDTAFPLGEQKSRRWTSSDFGALVEPANFTVLGGSLRSLLEPVKRKQTACLLGF